MPVQTIEVQQEQSVAAYGPAVITVEVDNKYATSPNTIRLTVCYRDVDYCDMSVVDAKALIAALQASVTEAELQTPKQCATTSAPSPSPQVVNCHQCQVAIATWSTRQMFDAGWNIGAGRYWYCPACKDAK